MGNALYRKDGNSLVRVRNLRHKDGASLVRDKGVYWKDNVSAFPTENLIHAYQFEQTDGLNGYKDSIGNLDILSTDKFQLSSAHIGDYFKRPSNPLDIPSSIDLSSPSAGCKSISFWIRFSGTNDYRFVTTLFRGTTSWLAWDSGNIGVSLNFSGGYYYFYSWADGFPYSFWQDETWHHCVVQNENGTPVFWLDNVRMPFPHGTGCTPSTDIFAPSRIVYTVNAYNGDQGAEYSIDQVYFYTQSLTLDEINTLYTETQPLDPNNPPTTEILIRINT